MDRLSGMKVATAGEVPAGVEEALAREGASLDTAGADRFDALIVASGDASGAERHITKAIDGNKPVVIFGDGASCVARTNLVRGRTLTAPAHLSDKIRDAGGTCIDEPVWIDGNWLSALEATDDVLGKMVELFAISYEGARIDPAPASS